MKEQSEYMCTYAGTCVPKEELKDAAADLLFNVTDRVPHSLSDSLAPHGVHIVGGIWGREDEETDDGHLASTALKTWEGEELD